MAQYVMVLRRARSITRGIGRVGPGNQGFLGPEMGDPTYSPSLQNNLEINSAI